MLSELIFNAENTLPCSLGKFTIGMMSKSFALLVSLAAFCSLSDAYNYNNSFVRGFAWATAKDVEALEKEMEMKEQKLTVENSFSSLDNMLQWAIGHSDPEKLRVTAQEIQKLSSKELERRREEIKELMEKLRMPSDAELMKIAIADLTNSSLSVEDRQRALHELLVLVEPIDNANDLNKLGGLSAIVNELYRAEEELRTTAAWVLGKASQNNPVVQKQILEIGVLPKLMRMVKSSGSEEAVKALYAVSAVIRNNLDGQAVFSKEGGGLMLQELMRNSSCDIRLRRKSLFLVADLAEHGLETASSVSSFQADAQYLKSVVDLLALPDLDVQEKAWHAFSTFSAASEASYRMKLPLEKTWFFWINMLRSCCILYYIQALMAVRSLLQLNNTYAQIFRDFCHLESVLKNLGQHLEELMLDHQWGDFATDVEALRQEVVSIFLGKIVLTT